MGKLRILVEDGTEATCFIGIVPLEDIAKAVAGLDTKGKPVDIDGDRFVDWFWECQDSTDIYSDLLWTKGCKEGGWVEYEGKRLSRLEQFDKSDDNVWILPPSAQAKIRPEGTFAFFFDAWYQGNNQEYEIEVQGSRYVSRTLRQLGCCI